MLTKILTNKFVLAVLILLLGLGMGYYFAPDKIKEVEKVVYKTKVEKEETSKTTKKFDPNTGKVIEETVEKGTKEKTVDEVGQEKSKETEKTRKNWAAKLGVTVPLNDVKTQIPRVGGEVRLPIFDSWAGLEIDVDIKRPVVGGYLRIEF